MTTRRRAAALVCAIATGLAFAPAPAEAARDCGVVGRPFTDGGAEVTVAKGELKCTTARGLLRRYWTTSVDAFARRLTVRHAGIRWTCRPTTDDFPYRWRCTGGGPDRNRFAVTARE
jgi:hypothetical protein